MQVIQKRVHKVLAAVVAVLCLVSFALAVDPVPLPDLQLTTADSQPIRNADLPSKGNWLLIYVQPKSQFSDSLLRLFKREQYPSLEQHAVIVVGGTVDDLKAVKARYAELD